MTLGQHCDIGCVLCFGVPSSKSSPSPGPPEGSPSVTSILNPTFPHPLAQLQVMIFCLLLKNKNPEAKVGRLWVGETVGNGVGPWLGSLLMVFLHPKRPISQASGRGGPFTAQGTVELLRGRGGQSLRKTLGWRDPKSCKGAEFPFQGPKANRVGDRPLVWQLRRGSFGWQDAGLFTEGSPGPSKPPYGTGRLFT